MGFCTCVNKLIATLGVLCILAYEIVIYYKFCPNLNKDNLSLFNTNDSLVIYIMIAFTYNIFSALSSKTSSSNAIRGLLSSLIITYCIFFIANRSYIIYECLKYHNPIPLIVIISLAFIIIYMISLIIETYRALSIKGVIASSEPRTIKIEV